MLPMLLAGMGAGLLKSELVDRPQADRQRKLAATTAALSPWTGMTPTMPQEANPLGSIMQGGLAGAQIGQAMQANPAAQTVSADTMPGTIIPKAGQPQKEFFQNELQKLKQQQMAGRPGSEYFMMG